MAVQMRCERWEVGKDDEVVVVKEERRERTGEYHRQEASCRVVTLGKDSTCAVVPSPSIRITSEPSITAPKPSTTTQLCQPATDVLPTPEYSLPAHPVSAAGPEILPMQLDGKLPMLNAALGRT